MRLKKCPGDIISETSGFGTLEDILLLRGGWGLEISKNRNVPGTLILNDPLGISSTPFAIIHIMFLRTLFGMKFTTCKH